MSLHLDNVSLSMDGKPHIYPTDLTLQTSTLNVLLGPTLSGKTSLLRLMAGLDKPSSGNILWKGEDVTHQHVRHRDVAMVYQQFINYPSLSVFENIASPLRLKKMSGSEIEKAVADVAEMLKLSEYLDRKPLELSGGQQQRCALARALVKQSGLVLLDEPLANLDYKLREELREEIPKIFEASGAIFVYATTEPEEALLLGGNTATLHQGKVTQFDQTARVYHNPQDKVTANTFSDPPMNFVPLQKADNSIVLGKNELNLTQTHLDHSPLKTLANGDYIAGFRPNHLALNKPSASAFHFHTKLDITELTGSETFLHLQYDVQQWVGLVHGVHNLASGSDLEVYLDPAYIYIFDQYGQLVSPAPYAQGLT